MAAIPQEWLRGAQGRKRCEYSKQGACTITVASITIAEPGQLPRSAWRRYL